MVKLNTPHCLRIHVRSKLIMEVLFLGDAINFMLTGSYSAGDAVDESYFEAQAKGQVDI